MKTCLNCKKQLSRYQKKYCSNQCQSDYQHKQYIKKWQLENVDGSRGVNTKNISQHIIKYLFEKFQNKCSLCGWSKINPITKKIPLEIDHIDGNFQNNKENNLRLICPNCHSLSATFRNLNKGKGRVWRKNKYIKE